MFWCEGVWTGLIGGCRKPRVRLSVSFSGSAFDSCLIFRHSSQDEAFPSLEVKGRRRNKIKPFLAYIMQASLKDRREAMLKQQWPIQSNTRLHSGLKPGAIRRSNSGARTPEALALLTFKHQEYRASLPPDRMIHQYLVANA